MIMGEVCFEFWGPDESRIYSEVPMGGSLSVWLGGPGFRGIWSSIWGSLDGLV